MRKKQKHNKGWVSRSLLSYGGGVQSFAILLAMKNGLIPMVECVAHADMSPYEPKTREHIQRVVMPIAKEMGIPFEIVGGGAGLREKLYQGIPMTPYWHDTGLNAQRLCTQRFKIELIDRLIARYAWVTLILGISADELRRVKDSDDRMSYGRIKTKYYPLIQLGWTRADCESYIRSCGYEVPPKSACYLCPFSSKRRLLENLIEIPGMYEEIKTIEKRWTERGSYERYLTVYRDQLPTPAEALVMLAEMDFSDNTGDGGCSSGVCFT